MPIPIPTLGDFTDSYADTFTKIVNKANNQQFTGTLQTLLESHIEQVGLLATIQGNAGRTNVRGNQLAVYAPLVESLCPDAFRGRNLTPFDKAMFVLLKTQLFQLGSFGGLQIPDNWQGTPVPVPAGAAAPAAAFNDEENDGLKRCSDGSLVPHGAGCP